MTENEFNILHSRERQNAISLATRLLSGRSADAEDCVQNAFAKLYRRRNRVTSATKYFYQVLRNECRILKEFAQTHDLCGSAENTLRRAGTQ